MNGKNLVVVNAASTDKTRYTINSIYLDKKHTVGTDGRMLLAVTYPGGGENENNVTIPRPVATKVIRFMGAGATVQFKKSGDKQTAKIARKDEEISLTFAPVDGQYPKWEQVLPEYTEHKAIRINAELMLKICKAVITFHGPEPLMDIIITNKDEPMIIKATHEGQELTGVIMPIYQPEEKQY